MPLRSPLAVLAVLALIACGPMAEAQAFAPVGLWRAVDGPAVLFVWGAGFCSVGGPVSAAGPCGFAPTATGGTLALDAEWTNGPDRLVLEVTWVDADTILVNGSQRFLRIGE